MAGSGSVGGAAAAVAGTEGGVDLALAENDGGEKVAGLFVCRVCFQQAKGQPSTMSLQTKVCVACLRSKILTLADGSPMRFCYEHRRVEALHLFKGEEEGKGVGGGTLS